MKKLILGLFFTLCAFQVNAATYYLYGSFADALSGPGSEIKSGESIFKSQDIVSSDTSYSWFLTVDPSQTSLVLNGGSPDGVVTLKELNVIDTNNTIGTGDDSSLASSTTLVNGGDLSVTAALVSGTIYELALDFITTGDSNINVTVSSVPVPAAVWLFGSALMGLVGISRRKTGSMLSA